MQRLSGRPTRTQEEEEGAKTVIQDVDVGRFNDLVLPSSQTRPRAKASVLRKHSASSDEEGGDARTRTSGRVQKFVQGGCEKHEAGEDLDLLPVAPNIGGR